MGFVFLVNGKQLPNTKIRWKFTDRDTIYESSPDKFLRNVAFWQNKMGLGANASYEILNGELKNKETYAEPIPAVTAIESISESNDSIVAEESSLPQSVEDSVDTPRKKSRRKAS